MLHNLKEIVKKLDLFSVSQFLRYKGKQSYQTLSGAICSIIIVGIFIGIFMNQAFATLTRTIIISSANVQRYNAPTRSTLNFSKASQFMFAIEVKGINLNEPNQRYFDVQIQQVKFKRGDMSNNLDGKIIRMESCTREHFSISQSILYQYDNLPHQRWLCPPLGYSYDIVGKFTGQQFSAFSLSLKKCDPLSNITRPCASDAKIDILQNMLGQFMVNFIYINAQINEGQQQYLTYYLEDKNYLAFTRKLGGYSSIFISDYQIKTDYSLLPFQQTVTETGIIIPELFTNIAVEPKYNVYANFYFMKNGESFNYTRSFNKLDNLFSYVGGLIGTILIFMFFINNFAQTAFCLQLSERLFYIEKEKPKQYLSFNIFSYFCLKIYQTFSYFGYCKQWKYMKDRQKSIQQVENQIDIQYIIQRMNFLQKAITTIIKQDQIKNIHQQKYDSIQNIQKYRNNHYNCFIQNSSQTSSQKLKQQHQLPFSNINLENSQFQPYNNKSHQHIVNSNHQNIHFQTINYNQIRQFTNNQPKIANLSSIQFQEYPRRKNKLQKINSKILKNINQTKRQKQSQQ